jgi:hypothetical protein
MTRKIFKIATIDPTAEVKAALVPLIDPDAQPTDSMGMMTTAIKEFASSKPAKPKSKNLIPVNLEEDRSTKNTSIAFFLLPEWAKNFPPYNIARLAALTKLNGYKTWAFDINVKAWRDSDTWGLDYDPWHFGRDWKWEPSEYFKDIHPKLEPLLVQYLDKIDEIKPTVIGLSVYYCNRTATEWFAKEIKKRHPNILIAVGGPEVIQVTFNPIPEFDYIVQREGEEALLEILRTIENEERPSEQYFFKQTRESTSTQRLDLDSLPLPDYSHFDLTLYETPNGVNSELSRGCVAKCTFCNETHFWKYRNRSASSAVDELVYLSDSQGTNFVYFIDSLVNGNMTELKEFAQGIIDSKKQINWMGYARCDKRMNLEFLTLLAESGCVVFNYGCESGSNKTLEAMAKKNTREDIELNLRDGAKVGIKAITNWLLGFPTETSQDFYETLMVVWRNRNNNIMCLSGGAGFAPNSESVIGWNLDDYKIDTKRWYGRSWISTDFKNTKFNRLFRVKTFNILSDFLVEHLNISTIKGNRPTTHKFYKINFNPDLVVDQIEIETFDFNIIQVPNGNVFTNQLVNEIWPILRLFWRSLQEYEIDIIFNHELDSNEYGSELTGGLTASIKFSIKQTGEWTANFNFDYVQEDNAWSGNNLDNPNFTFNYQYINSGQW